MTEVQLNSTWNQDDCDSDCSASSSISLNSYSSSCCNEKSEDLSGHSSTPNTTADDEVSNYGCKDAFVKGLSPTGRSLSPIVNRSNISLLNLSISPVPYTNNDDDDDDDVDDHHNDHENDAGDNDDRNHSTRFQSDDEISLLNGSPNDYVSLEELNLQIQTPPLVAPHTPIPDRRLNLETIFEDVFLETPPRKDMNVNCWKGILIKRKFNNNNPTLIEELTKIQTTTTRTVEQTISTANDMNDDDTCIMNIIDVIDLQEDRNYHNNDELLLTTDRSVVAKTLMSMESQFCSEFGRRLDLNQ